jgi:hypothetical protein
VLSAEYLRDDWSFAAEYSRWRIHQTSSVPGLIPDPDSDSEHFYGLISRRLSPALEAGAYYSAVHVDVHDRGGRDQARFPRRWNAFQRDAAVSLRYDVNDHWLWKLEGHFIDGVADLPRGPNPDPERYWGLFLFKTTVWF